MKEIKIQQGTDLNKIIDKLNKSTDVAVSTGTKHQFDAWIFDALPKSLIGLMKHIDSAHKKDTALLAILTIESALIKNYLFEYDGKMEGCQLYVYLLADPAQGKGSAANYRQLGLEFHLKQVREFREQLAQYTIDYGEWEKNGEEGEKPIKPLRSFLFLPANNTKTSFIRNLQENNGYGLIYETV